MASKSNLVELVTDEKVAPGWTYSQVQQKFYPPNRPKKLSIEKNIMSKFYLQPQASWKDSLQLHSWPKDLDKMNINQVIHITVSKVVEITGNSVERHLYHQVVNSVKEECFFQVVIALCQPINENDRSKLVKIVSNSGEGEIPEDLSKLFVLGSIQENQNSLITEFASLKEVVTHCRSLLMNSEANKTSRTAFLLPPKPAFGSTPGPKKHENKMESDYHVNASDKHNLSTVPVTESKITEWSGKILSTAHSGQQGTSCGDMTDTHKTGTTRVSNEVTQQISNLKIKEVNGHLPTTEQPQLSEAQSKQSFNSFKSCEHCQEKTLDNGRVSARTAVHGCHENKQSSENNITLKDMGHRKYDLKDVDNCDKETARKSVLPESVEQSSASLVGNASVSTRIIASCKSVLASPAEDKLEEHNSMTEENQLSTQNKGTKKAVMSGEKLKHTQKSLSTTSRTLNENEELEEFNKSFSNKEPLQRVHDKEQNADIHKKHLTSKDGGACNSEGTTKSTRVRQKVTPLQASKSSYYTRSSVTSHKYPFNSHTKETRTDKLKKFQVLKPDNSKMNSCGIVCNYYGVPKSRENEKVIILIGGSKSGKTTLVNFIANYFKGVEAADEKIILLENTFEDGPSHTKSITAYTFCFHENDGAVTVIDTPGLSDGDGREEREDKVQALKTLLVNNNFKIHVIGLVVPSNLVHLTSSERLMIDDIFTRFGETVADHIITFITFADNLQTPPAIDVLKSHGVRSKVVLQFNNSAISLDSKDINEFDKIFWRKGIKNLKKCFAHLNNSLSLSINTLKATQLEAYSATVTETSKNNLREALIQLIHLLQVSTKLTEENLAMCDRVWETATLLHCVMSTSGHVAPGVEGTLLAHTKQVTKELSFSSENLATILSLTSSRGLLSAGIWTISSLAPLYDLAITTTVDQSPGRKKPDNQYCRRCKETHIMVRQTENSMMNYIPVLSYSKYITYKCSTCSCLSNCHVEYYERKPQSLNLNPNSLLQYTKSIIKETLEKFSLPGHVMSQHSFLHYINAAQCYKFQNFIEKLQMM